MKISKRIISFVLTVATVIGVLASMPAIQISASQSMTVEATEEQKKYKLYDKGVQYTSRKTGKYDIGIFQ